MQRLNHAGRRGLLRRNPGGGSMTKRPPSYTTESSAWNGHLTCLRCRDSNRVLLIRPASWPVWPGRPGKNAFIGNFWAVINLARQWRGSLILNLQNNQKWIWWAGKVQLQFYFPCHNIGLYISIHTQQDIRVVSDGFVIRHAQRKVIPPISLFKNFECT